MTDAEAQLVAAREALTAYGDLAMAIALVLDDYGAATLYSDFYRANQLGVTALAASGTPPQQAVSVDRTHADAPTPMELLAKLCDDSLECDLGELRGWVAAGEDDGDISNTFAQLADVLDALVAERDAAERAERHVARAHRDAEAQLVVAREALTQCAELDAWPWDISRIARAALAASDTPPPEREPPEPKDVGRLTEATDIAKRAVAFWVRDYDHTGTPAGIVEVDENTVQITPTAGMRIWIYCAEMPWDPRDGPEMRRDGLGKRYPEAWCASKVFPDGEYGIIHPGQHEGEYRPLTKGMFLAAAALGWPDYE